MKRNGFYVLMVILVFFACTAEKEVKLEIALQTELTTHGSTRATAYSMSNKIITADGKKYVTWLDSVSNIMIQSIDLATNQWSDPVLLGKGVDNHSGAALTMDSEGYIYAVFGPHHGPFQFARSAAPYDISLWEQQPEFGQFGTYPGLVCDSEDVLHLTYRGGPMPRRLIYQQKKPGKSWSTPKALVYDDVGDTYTQFGNPIAVSPSGVLHVGFHIYDLYPPAGNYVGYLQSPDAGTTWTTAKGDTVDIPATPDTDCFIEKGKELNMRVGNLVLDNQERPWLSVVHLEEGGRTNILYYLDNHQWHGIDLLPHLRQTMPEKVILYATLTFDAANRLYVAATVQDSSNSDFWGVPGQEVVLLFSVDQGQSFDVYRISESDSTAPAWLPGIERPFSHQPIGTPAVLHTRGGPGTDLVTFIPTSVFFTRLDLKE
ncbi:hypothetical protein GF407_13430 [candidate division KSB1 bacterium]|nr:hypothetical protein [candidate division KSB1 bacterium]